MSEDGVRMEGWNTDTIQRYLSVGCRPANTDLRQLLMLWETKFQRNAFLDQISVLRACIGVTSDNTELVQMMQVMFMDQCSGLKRSLKADSKTPPATIFKAYLIRIRLFGHLRTKFQNYADVIDIYGGAGFFTASTNWAGEPVMPMFVMRQMMKLIGTMELHLKSPATSRMLS